MSLDPPSSLRLPHPAHVDVAGSAAGRTHLNQRNSADGPLLEMRKRLADSNRQMQSSAWLIGMLQRIAECESVEVACHELASEFKQFLAASTAVVTLRDSNGVSRVMSVTDVADLDHDGERARHYRMVADEAINRGTAGYVSAANVTSKTENPAEPAAEPSHAHRSLSAGDRDVVSVPLTVREGAAVGVLMLLFPAGRIAAERTMLPFCTAAAGPIASQIRQCQRGQRGRLRRMMIRIRESSPFKQIALAGCVVVTVGVLWIPMTYRIACSFAVEPLRRHYCVAPHDGVLQRTLVSPGDDVAAGQILAAMDGSDVRLELAGLIAENARLSRQRDVHIAAHESAKAVQTELEIERLAARRGLLQRRDATLQIVAPVSGIVLAGNADNRENFPVKQGDLVYEVATLNKLRFEVLVPDDEIQHVSVAMAVSLEVDGLGGTSYAATISRLYPQASVVDGQNGFIAVCVLENHDGRLRPGMRGDAKIQAATARLGWITFHRVIDRVRRWW